MAKAEILFKIIRKWEGGWSDHKNDRGGKTNMGITLVTWKSCGYDKDGDGDIDADDLRLITPEDVFNIFKKYYWDRYQADLYITSPLLTFVWTGYGLPDVLVSRGYSSSYKLKWTVLLGLRRLPVLIWLTSASCLKRSRQTGSGLLKKSVKRIRRSLSSGKDG